MDNATELTPWQEIGPDPRAVTVSHPTPGSLSSRMADLTDLVPVSREEFATEIVPCLALVGGAGMNFEARREWLNAAYKALHGIPILLLQRGAQAAMAKADHPSKIVPTILDAIQSDWDWRRNYIPRPVRTRRNWEPAPPISQDERKEVAAMFDDLLKKYDGDPA